MLENLPRELIHYIISHIRNQDKISLACVSRNFQLATELFNFSRISIKSFQLSQFAHHFRYAHRRDALRSLRYSILLPRYTANSAQRFESKRAKRINNEVFTRAVVGLLRVLSSWDEHDHIDTATKYLSYSDDHGGGVDLHIFEIFSESDPHRRGSDFENQLCAEPWKDLKSTRYLHSNLRLVPVPSFEIGSITLDNESMAFESHSQQQSMELDSFVSAIPLVQRVTKFTVNFYPNLYRNIETATVIMLAGRIPNLKVLCMDSMRDDAETRFVELRQRMRLEAGQSLLKICRSGQYFTQLHSFKLYIPPPTVWNHDFSVSALHPSYPNTDFLSLGLHAISRLPNIKTLDLGIRKISLICVSPALFWPATEDTDSDASPSWPSLQKFEIALPGFTPCGKWYITHGPASHRPPPPLPSSPIYSSGSDPEAEDSFSDRSVTPPPLPTRTARAQSYLNPMIGADSIHLRREERLAGRKPIHLFRTILDPETFTPMILAVLKMISVAKRQKLASFVFSLELRPPSEVDFELYFFRSNVDLDQGLQDFESTLEQTELRDRDRLIIRVGKESGWDVIQSQDDVGKALRQAVGECGTVRVDTISAGCRGSQAFSEVDTQYL